MAATQTFGPEMGAIELIASVTSSLAWPMLIGFTIYTYRKPITKLLVGASRMIRRMNSLKWGEFELASRRIQEAKDVTIEKVDAVEEKISQASPDQLPTLLDELIDLRLQIARLDAAQAAIAAAKSAPSSDGPAKVLHLAPSPDTKARYARQRTMIREMVSEIGAQRVVNMEPSELRDLLVPLLQKADRDYLLDFKSDFLVDSGGRPTSRLLSRVDIAARSMLRSASGLTQRLNQKD